MPTYVYKCKACLKEFEEVQKFSDEPLRKCPSCRKQKLVRLISGSGLVFKGSGFYLTDYKKRSTSESEGSPSPAKEPASKKKDDASGGGKSESKSDSTRDSKSESKNESTPESKPAEKPSSKKKR